MFRAAWPVARVLTVADRADIGFAMPRLADPAYRPMRVMFVPSDRDRAFPGATWNRYLMLAADLARAVGLVNERNYTIGDLCPENLFVTPAATVALTDVDDWQTGRSGDPGALPCRGSRPAYSPPEHLSDAIGDAFREPFSDWWALAVVIGELLFIGRRPFEGFPPGADPSWDEPDNVRGRHCWLLDDRMEIARATPSRSLLTGGLLSLFETCFDAGYQHPSGRPSPRQWADALDATLGELITCDVDPLHVYPRGAGRCPWCAVAARGNVHLFGSGAHRRPGDEPAAAARPSAGAPHTPSAPPRPGRRRSATSRPGPAGRAPARPAPARPAARRTASRAGAWWSIAVLLLIVASIVLVLVAR
jgi:DNA-binding helix-hairpin-helix protein with protein kinase domain